VVLLGEHQAELDGILAGELAAVEQRFASELRSDLPCVNELAGHLEQYRGKMLRPTLVLVCGLATAPEQPLVEAHRVLATVVEMVHMATLVHDDVLDDQDLRRKGSTINRLQGNEAAVMLGDYLISHAYHLCASLDSQAAARLIAMCTNTVCEGELLQLDNRDNWELDEPTYFQIIRRKTAVLTGVSCRLGAMSSGGSPEICQRLERYGELMGTAFQIVDDVLDLTGDVSVVGKTLGKDLEKGKLTLPLIHRLAALGGEDRQQMLEMIDSHDPRMIEQVGQLLAEGDSVAYARRCAEQRVAEAKGLLDALPPSPARGTLIRMADAVIARQF